MQTQRFVQNHNATMNFNDTQFIFTDGLDSLGNTTSPMGNGDITTTWNLNNCHFIATRPAGNTSAVGWGAADSQATVQGFPRNCTWQGTSNADAQDRYMFINSRDRRGFF